MTGGSTGLLYSCEDPSQGQGRVFIGDGTAGRVVFVGSITQICSVVPRPIVFQHCFITSIWASLASPWVQKAEMLPPTTIERLQLIKRKLN